MTLTPVRRLLRLIAALSAVIAITGVCFRILTVNATTAAIVYILTVLVLATAWGIAEAVSASVVAILCFNFFFLPPIHTFRIEDPQNWVAFFAFLITSIIVSHLSSQARQRTEESMNRRLEMERLYELSRAMLLETGRPVAAAMASSIVRIFACDGISFFDRAAGQVFHGGDGAPVVPDSRLIECAQQGTEFRDPASGAVTIPVRLGGRTAGALSLRAGCMSDAALYAVGNLSAIALEREAAHIAAAKAEAYRRGEELKSTLLDAVAHEFKTPLTSIKAAATAMLESAARGSSEHELLTIVDEETERLNEMVTEAIQMARIEAGKVQLNQQPVALGELIDGVLKSSASFLEDRPVELRLSEGLPTVIADRDLIGVVLRQLVNNAAKYSPPHTAIEIDVLAQDSNAVVAVSNLGPGIAEVEQARIFEKFYRAAETREQVPGTGMGLTIAREIMNAHKGQIWVESELGRGARFSISLPLVPKRQSTGETSR